MGVNNFADLWFIPPVYTEFSLETLQCEAKTSSATLGGSLHDLLAPLAKLSQTLALSETHLSLEM